VEDDQSDVALLVAAAAQGDEGAWGEIVDRFTPLLVAVVLRYRGTLAGKAAVAP